MEKIRNLSIRKTIILYISVSLAVSFLAAAVLIQVAAQTQQSIWMKYVDEEKYLEAVKKESDAYIASVPRVRSDDMSRIDGFVSEACDFLETWSILVLSIIGMIAAVFLFYRDKIKQPLEEMTVASQMIANNELDFRMNYKNQDELGRLCAEFERMRAELEKNNRQMWRMVEDEKALRSAIAHDIRTPIAILQGYQEMLMEFIPGDTLSTEKIMEMLQEGMTQIERVNSFAESMRTMSSLDQRELCYAEVSLDGLAKQVKTSVQIIAGNQEKNTGVHLETAVYWENRTYINQVMHQKETDVEGVFCADSQMILEVAENLISNAVRYAKRRVEVVISLSDTELEVRVEDDGCGFTAGAEQVTKAFYHSNPQDDFNHSGMGMYIARAYCEKHGGRLLLGNQEQGGAVVRAVFAVKNAA